MPFELFQSQLLRWGFFRVTFLSLFFFWLASDIVFLFAQEMVPDEPSEGDREPVARRSPSGLNASGSPGAQV